MKTIKVLSVVCILLVGVTLWSLYNATTVRSKYSAQIQNYQDSLTYYHYVEQANHHLLNNDYKTAMKWYAKADSIGGKESNWKSRSLAHAQSSSRLRTASDSLLSELDELNSRMATHEATNSTLAEAELDYKSMIDSLKATILVTSLNLNKANQDKKELHHRLSELSNSFVKLAFENEDGAKITYYGAVKDGKANGFGIGIFEKTKGVYEGEWKDNVRHGKGKYVWANGDYYEGEFNKGKREGQGTYYFASGEKYIGEWEDDLRSGDGVVYSKEGQIVLNGTWSNDKFKKK